MDPLTLLAVSRPVDFIDSLARTFKVLAELRALARAPINDDLKFLEALRHGVPATPATLKEPAPSDILRRTAGHIDALFDFVNADHRGDRSAFDLRVDARVLQLVSGPEDGDLARIHVERQTADCGSSADNWRYFIRYLSGAMRPQEEESPPNKIMLFGDNFMEARVLFYRTDQQRHDWRALSFQEAANLETDMRYLLDVRRRGPLSLLMRTQNEDPHFDLNV